MIKLCERERQILRLLNEGFAFHDIAKKLQLSPRTIEFLIAEIKCKSKNAGENFENLIATSK